MNIFKQIAAIVGVSVVIGILFNMFSPNGIDIFGNPWSKLNSDTHVEHTDCDHQPVEDSPVLCVGLDRACQFIDNQEGVILDARNPEEYAEGHIAGAQLLFFYKMNEYYPALEEQLRESSSLLVYCGNVNCDDSEFLANELFNLGYSSILVYKGGFDEWKENELPVEKGKEETEG